MPNRRELANAIRVLSMDAVQKAGGGHPGAPMGMADMAEVLWNDFLKHDPVNPDWPDRDRFLLSNGHASMLLYSLLHLSGYDLSIEEIKNLRQIGSKTPGHPEVKHTAGVETTTGPLGQGLANAVGMAVAEKTLAAQFNRDGHEIIDHHTYVFLGDGCLMEGISHEVCSLAGTLGLGKLIGLYDSNSISIDGKVEGWFTDDTAARFKAYGWHVISGVDGHDADDIKQAISAAKAEVDRPTLVICTTTIGFGSPNKGGTADSHGSALGDDEIAKVREQLDWNAPAFEIPDQVRQGWDAREAGKQREAEWQKRMEAYRQAHPEAAAELERRLAGKLPDGWKETADKAIAGFAEKGEKIASRKASQNALEAFGPALPEFIGGSADLAGSNNTIWSGSKNIKEDPAGNYIYFGVREFGMSAIANGISTHGGFLPYVATFLTFSDYSRNALRMAALMKIKPVFVFTHDSISLGGDGPTHQPVEHLAALRMIPRMSVWRPCDTVETGAAWRSAIESNEQPHCLLFSRHTLEHQPRSDQQIADIARGAYVLRKTEGAPDAILLATGSEVSLAMDAAKLLDADGLAVQVVSMPSADRFDAQDQTYRDSVLPPQNEARIAVEAGVSDFWRKYVGLKGAVMGQDTYGESGDPDEMFAHFGFTPELLADLVRKTHKSLA